MNRSGASRRSAFCISFALDELHKIINGTFGIIYSVINSVYYLGEVVGRNVGRHTDGNSYRAVYKQIRKSGGKDRRLVSRVIEVSRHRNDVLFDIAHHIICDTSHSRLGVTVCSRAVTVHVTEVSVTLDKRIS